MTQCSLDVNKTIESIVYEPLPKELAIEAMMFIDDLRNSNIDNDSLEKFTVTAAFTMKMILYLVYKDCVPLDIYTQIDDIAYDVLSELKKSSVSYSPDSRLMPTFIAFIVIVMTWYINYSVNAVIFHDNPIASIKEAADEVGKEAAFRGAAGALSNIEFQQVAINAKMIEIGFRPMEIPEVICTQDIVQWFYTSSEQKLSTSNLSPRYRCPMKLGSLYVPQGFFGYGDYGFEYFNVPKIHLMVIPQILSFLISYVDRLAIDKARPEELGVGFGLEQRERWISMVYVLKTAVDVIIAGADFLRASWFQLLLLMHRFGPKIGDYVWKLYEEQIYSILRQAEKDDKNSSKIPGAPPSTTQQDGSRVTVKSLSVVTRLKNLPEGRTPKTAARPRGKSPGRK